MTLLELLQAESVDEFNAKRGQRVTLDLFAADLAGLSLAGVDLSNANLEKADLSGCDLSGANLSRANLCGADLTGANLAGCVAIRARLREAYLGQAKLMDAEFAGADLSEADLSDVDATNGRFAGARLKEAVLANAILVGADLNEARLANADLRGADLTGAKLAQAELSRVNASGAKLEGADLKGARLAGAALRTCHLARADLSGADLSGADLTGSDLTGANLERADLFEVQSEEGTFAGARLPAGFAAGGEAAASAPVPLHFDEPAVAVSGNRVAALWENPEEEDTLRLRAVVHELGTTFDGTSHPLAVAVDQVIARMVVPVGAGAFACVLFVDRPAGVEMIVMDLDAAAGFGAPRSIRLGYTPVVKPVLVPDEETFLIFGIGRQGALSVHRLEESGLTERMRAPAHTYRGFCGRMDPVLLGKGGTVAAVRADGIGKLLTAPAGYPGRVTAAAYRADGEQIALAWTVKGERGFRFQVLGVDTEPVRVDTVAEVGALDLLAVDDRWLALYTREGDRTSAMAAWLPGGKPFPVYAGDVEDARFALGVPGRKPVAALVTDDEALALVEIGADTARVLGKLGG